MTGSIYIIKNFANGKVYVGKTTTSVQKRFQSHIQEAFDKKKSEYNYCISRGIRKYGKNAFDVAVLADNVPKDKLALIEAHYIDMYSSTNPEYGYNMSPGHDNTANHQYYRDLQPDDDYEDSNVFDSITDEEINSFLEEL